MGEQVEAIRGQSLQCSVVLAKPSYKGLFAKTSAAGASIRGSHAGHVWRDPWLYLCVRASEVPSEAGKRESPGASAVRELRSGSHGAPMPRHRRQIQIHPAVPSRPWAFWFAGATGCCASWHSIRPTAMCFPSLPSPAQPFAMGRPRLPASCTNPGLFWSSSF